MIKGKKVIELTIDNVLQRTTELAIFHKYMPWKWELNNVCISPFPSRNGYEKTPSFIIGNKYGNIAYKAFNEEDKKGDCFNFVKQLHNLPNLDAVLRLIDRDLNLGISDGREVQSSPITQANEPKITKRNTLIQISVRRFLNSEIEWWNAYYQDIADLKENNIYSIKKAYLNKQLLSIGDDELRFGYYYPEGGYWKLYFPNREKKKKWIGNVPLHTSWGTENLEKGKNSLICKSLKDYLVCRKILSPVCGIQNESLAAFSEEFVNSVKENSKGVFYGGDSDAPGKQASYAITGAFGYKHINPPDNLLNCCKDFADMGKYRSLKEVEEHFKIKGLL